MITLGKVLPSPPLRNFLRSTADSGNAYPTEGGKKMNLRSFNFNRVYLDPLSKSNAVTFLKLPNKLFISGLFVICCLLKLKLN